MHPLFKTFFIVIVLLDVTLLALAKHEPIIDEEEQERLNRDSMIFVFSNFAFCFEFILKLIALELKTIFKDRLSILEGLLSLIFLTLFLIDQMQSD